MDISSILDTGSSSSSLSTSDTSAAAVSPTSSSSVTGTTSIVIPSTTLSTTSSTPAVSSTTPSTSIFTTSSSSSPSSSDSSSTSSPIISPTTSSITLTSTVLPTSSTSSTPVFTTSIQITTVSNSGTQTITVTNSITPAASASSSTTSLASDSSSSSSSSFWSNKGAVAGTFTVVALVGVAIIIWVIILSIRRRRAHKFDQENEAAAAEAANATAPAFLDDDDDPIYRRDYLHAGDMSSGGYSGYEGGGAVPSASSHGTFNQPPMGIQPNENYPMAEFGSVLYPGASPYPITMAPGQNPQHNNYYDHGFVGNEPLSASTMKTVRPTSGDFDILEQQQQRNEGGSDATNYTSTGTPHTTPSVSRGHSTTTSTSHSRTDLFRNKSQGSRSLIDGYYSKAPSTTGGHDMVSPHSGESYAAHYQPGFSGMPKSSPSRRSTFGYDEAPPLPNLFSKTIDDEAVDESDDEGFQQKKVLKVANE